MSYYPSSPLPAPVLGVRRLWNRAYMLTVLAGAMVAIATMFVTFFHMYGLMLVAGWAAFTLLGISLVGVISAMYLMGVVTDDFSVIRPFRSEALTEMYAPMAVFVFSGLSLAISTFAR